MGIIGREIGHFFVGIMFLTRLPVPSGLRQVEGRLARSARYFPLVGVLIGLLTGLVYLITSQGLPPFVCAGLTIVAGLLITGALHEDGLADTCDGLGGGATRERALEIMQDSRIGTYGACGLICSIGIRGLVLSYFDAYSGLIALIVCHAVSRAVIPPVLVAGHYARSRGLASSVAGGVSRVEAGVAVVLAFAIAFIAGPVAAIASMAAAFIAGGLMLAILVRRIGGYTGDGLGAIQQLAEIAVLITLAGIWA